MDTNAGMTIRDIAELCNVEGTTIRRWIQKGVEVTSAKCLSASAKCLSARADSEPALFDLEEVIAIIRAGGREVLADMLMDNAIHHFSFNLPGPVERVEFYAVTGYIYSLFAGSPDMSVQKINRLLYLLSVRPPLTNGDIATLMGVSDSSISLWRRKLPEALVAKAAASLSLTDQGNAVKLLALPEEAKEAVDA